MLQKQRCEKALSRGFVRSEAKLEQRKRKELPVQITTAVGVMLLYEIVEEKFPKTCGGGTAYLRQKKTQIELMGVGQVVQQQVIVARQYSGITSVFSFVFTFVKQKIVCIA